MATPPDFTTGAVLTAAQMNAVGLWLVGSTSFGPTATSAELDNVFTSDFQTYEIHWIINPSTAVNMFMQMRTGGANNATSNYSQQKSSFAATTVATTRSTSQTSFGPADLYSTSDANTGKITVFRPQATARTTFIATAQTALTDATQWQATGQFGATTSFDGFRFFTSSGTFSGNMKVYGYRD
jgi:hypothetical protein